MTAWRRCNQSPSSLNEDREYCGTDWFAEHQAPHLDATVPRANIDRYDTVPPRPTSASVPR
jgi:hypothetical protein